MFSEFELPLGFEDCRTGPPREPRAGRDASWNKLERTRAEARARTGCVCFLSGLRAGCDASGKLRSSRIRNTLGLERIGC
ncbi:hypothetical protein F2Q69_00052146 [Brassica cretica]|uniref:Uncharacterized protein n=1 Tax=Brassica cretica TaxID=69181 RepID=A0A8S9N7R3_BRACR|nr:hypothetical protein F2Q69_00052146 [Brassica cretica]